jgi:tRNA A-37 threonylcarbamoyl transferase component Bud32
MNHDVPYRSQVYKLVRDLHRVGIEHGDLEPRNIARNREGGLCLIDFSESRMHVCKESKVRYITASLSFLLTFK